MSSFCNLHFVTSSKVYLEYQRYKEYSARIRINKINPRSLNTKVSWNLRKGGKSFLVSEMTKNIKVSDDVHYDLGELGKLSESYNDVIRRLINHYKKTKRKERGT